MYRILVPTIAPWGEKESIVILSKDERKIFCDGVGFLKRCKTKSFQDITKVSDKDLISF